MPKKLNLTTWHNIQHLHQRSTVSHHHRWVNSSSVSSEGSEQGEADGKLVHANSMNGMVPLCKSNWNLNSPRVCRRHARVSLFWLRSVSLNFGYLPIPISYLYDWMLINDISQENNSCQLWHALFFTSSSGYRPMCLNCWHVMNKRFNGIHECDVESPLKKDTSYDHSFFSIMLNLSGYILKLRRKRKKPSFF